MSDKAKTISVVYVGPCEDGVLVPLPEGGNVDAHPGEPIEVSAAHGARLLEQPTNWQPAKRQVADPRDPR